MMMLITAPDACKSCQNCLEETVFKEEHEIGKQIYQQGTARR